MKKENLITKQFEGMNVDFKKGEDGTYYVSLEQVARFAGWTQTKNNKEYVKWERVTEFVSFIRTSL